MLVLDEITTHLDYHTVVGLIKALRAFNGALLLVSHDRFLMKCVIEGDTSSLVEENETSSEDGERAQLQRSLYLLKNGRLNPLDDGVREFEESLERKVEKLSV